MAALTTHKIFQAINFMNSAHCTLTLVPNIAVYSEYIMCYLSADLQTVCGQVNPSPSLENPSLLSGIITAVVLSSILVLLLISLVFTVLLKCLWKGKQKSKVHALIALLSVTCRVVLWCEAIVACTVVLPFPLENSQEIANSVFTELALTRNAQH